MKKILLIVDPQNDFITGTLTVKGAKEKMMKLADYIQDEGCKYDYVCITLDSHPENHTSFKENEGIWPKYYVVDTNGWNIPEYLEDAMQFVGAGKKIYFGYYHKGTEADQEEYSIFDSEDGNTLSEQIGAESYEQVDSILREILAWKWLSLEKRGDTYDSVWDMRNAFLEEQQMLDTPIEVIIAVTDRHFKSEFKRKQLPIKITRETII